MLPFFLISHFTISTLNFKPSFSPYIHIHRKTHIHTSEASSIDKEAQNPPFWLETPFSHFSALHFQIFHFRARASGRAILFFSRRVVRANALLLRRNSYKRLSTPIYFSLLLWFMLLIMSLHSFMITMIVILRKRCRFLENRGGLIIKRNCKWNKKNKGKIHIKKTN
jgi:hypothetical protein